jgi:ATP-dependent protease ClpP protease subunit
MSPEEAQKYGLIDKVLTRQELPNQRQAVSP